MAKLWLCCGGTVVEYDRAAPPDSRSLAILKRAASWYGGAKVQRLGAADAEGAEDLFDAGLSGDRVQGPVRDVPDEG